MHRLKPFLNVGLNNFLSLGLQNVQERPSKKKTDVIDCRHVWVRNTITAPFLMII